MQSRQLGSAQTPQMAAPATRPRKDTRPTDDLAALTFTDDQKAKIDQIHREMKPRLDAVVKDEKLDAVQKDAMLEGLLRMEGRQVFKVLTPEQRQEVRGRILARRAAEQEESKKKRASSR